jgi:hypothetical protein
VLTAVKRVRVAGMMFLEHLPESVRTTQTYKNNKI